MKTTKTLISDAFRDLLRLYIEVERQDDEQARLKVFYERAFRLLSNLLHVQSKSEILTEELPGWGALGPTTHCTVYFTGLINSEDTSKKKEKNDACKIFIREQDWNNIKVLVGSLKESTLASKKVGNEFIPFSIKTITTTTVHRPYDDIRKNLVSKLVDIEICGYETENDFYSNLVFLGQTSVEDNFETCPDFSRCEWVVLFDLVRSVVIHYFYIYDDTSKIQICSNCGQIHARIYREGKKTFCSDECRKHFDYNKHSDAVKCLIDVKRYYEKIIVDEFGENGRHRVQDLKLTRTYCKKCELQKKISHPKECPQLLDNGFAQNLRLMDKS
jgi:hypothetical protein